MRFPFIARLGQDSLQLVLILASVLLVRTAVASPYYVPSGSMEPTLQIGDELLSTKYPYGYGRFSPPIDLGPSVSGRWLEKLPERGDVVVFQPPRHADETWVKRVVGLPGDHIQMRDGFLRINGQDLPVRRDGSVLMEGKEGDTRLVARFIETLPNGRQHPILKQHTDGPLDNTPELIVPPGHLFMMGDNRDHSWDSRAPEALGGIGFVPFENLIGRSEIILGSWDFPNAQKGVRHWVEGVRLSRFFTAINGSFVGGLPPPRDNRAIGRKGRQMSGLYLEDMAVGQTFGSSRLRVSEAEIKAFAAAFDPQPFHLDAAAAQQSVFGGLAASGWHTAALTMRLLVEGPFKPVGGILGAGFDAFRWPLPVRPDDELHLVSEVLEVRPSRSRPSQGLVKLRTTTFNQLNEAVQVMVANIVVPRCPS